MAFGNPKLSTAKNIITIVFFFFFGSTYLLFYNTLLNLSDLLATHFDYSLSYTSTFPLFYNWFNFLVAIILTVLASFLKKFPFNIFAHLSFVIHIILFIVTPFVLVYIPSNAAGFWVMIIMSTLNGVPTPMNASVFMGLSGMFSGVHSAMYFIGMAAGGVISSVLRIISGAIFKNEPNSDFFLSFYLNCMVAMASYAMYIYMYFAIPITQELYEQTNIANAGDETQTILKEETSLQAFIRLIKKMAINLFSIGFVFFVTLSIFPGFFTNTQYKALSSSFEQASVVLTITTIFMIGDLLSRFCVYIPIPWNKWLIFIFSVSRVVFYIPVFCYYYIPYTTPWYMFFIMLLFSFTNGYVSAWAIQIAYKEIDPADMKVAGNLVMVSMNVGLSIGGTLLFILSSTLPNPLDGSSSA
ncbi:equilibrative nucleoside transporter, putative [Entamoeba invadens IP1]|uniref:Equilibrative nucleoside transporter, putative n=1 Tax=Entamoeba invadens IP1 TaxID=370355 RepID=A0A0A1UCA0_ENTIV|nr:equilibrative nucleoside transporter, putative [Entamoeba invadens IP1]ELP92768.1 equilibrative nucleoside transporter, putative [Entamoeba invadens IP1]|eukprot:XP_004259539.1 equilibrative nucleoside transporter, putative [Entamoeba invadens IP1]